MRKIVLPGEKIADRKVIMEKTFVDVEATYASVMGMINEEGRFIPLEGVYRPAPGDTVVGLIINSRHAGFEVDLNLPSTGFISARDTRVRLNVGELVMARVREASEGGDIDLTEVRRLPKGNLIVFPSAKVPRLIGKKSSMINMIKEQTNSDILVGNNGYVWMAENTDIPRVTSILERIVQRAHLSGLTDDIAKALSS